MVRLAAQGGNRHLDINPLAVYSFFINRNKQNLHIILCFSPIGSAFRTRLRLYPSLINCCTIDWFEVAIFLNFYLNLIYLSSYFGWNLKVNFISYHNHTDVQTCTYTCTIYNIIKIKLCLQIWIILQVKQKTMFTCQDSWDMLNESLGYSS